MALLYRFVKVPDRANSHVFTFIVTRSVTRDLERDVTSKEFNCGHHRWAITFSRTDKLLGVYLVWRSASHSIRVYVDFTFTIMNREHFSVNEAFSGKQVKFTMDCPAQGNRSYIPVSELYSRNFTDPNGEFQLELRMGQVRTVFDAEFRAAAQTLLGQLHHQPKPPNKLETSYFTFGGFDWNLAMYPYGTRDMHGHILEETSPKGWLGRRCRLEYRAGSSQEPCVALWVKRDKGDLPDEGGGSSSEGRISVYLNRCTGFDHQCRVRYSMVLGDGDRRIDSGLVDDVSDSDGKSYGWHPRARFHDLIYKGAIRVHLEMVLANTVSEVSSGVLVGGVGSSGLACGAHHQLVLASGLSQCYDRDKQGWCIKTDCHSETVRLHMVYKDIHNVPRNHLRYVSWTAYLLRYQGKGKGAQVEPVPLPGAPFSHYYAQEQSDEGIIMETDVIVKELREPGCPYLSEKGQVKVQVEWEESYLLFQATYHKYDDVSRLHNQQMRKEINALQAENYSLERQLFSYQKSIAYAHSRGTYSDDLGSMEGRGEEEEDEERYMDERSYERSLSTDTEYA